MQSANRKAAKEFAQEPLSWRWRTDCTLHGRMFDKEQTRLKENNHGSIANNIRFRWYRSSLCDGTWAQQVKADYDRSADFAE